MFRTIRITLEPVLLVVIPSERGFSPRVEGPAVTVIRITSIRSNVRDHKGVSRNYYVYILASRSRTLYVGVTSDLILRTRQHRDGSFGGFTSKYNVNRLVHYERFAWIGEAIAREKQVKCWRREKKIWLIERENPTWEDLADEWLHPQPLRIRESE
ncbi:MAG TPA: GIY-YIG nuclease family protein [Bryocella sp.]|nr:GIY-YIG nuclease family protein [Bryocella sp.]